MAKGDSMARADSIDCREVRQLLPLWIGQDLPDVTRNADVARHLEQCPSCEQHRNGLQASLESLQCIAAESFSSEHSRHSVWPKLVSRICEWERNHRRERFNGWIPASVMALAVALMVAVSIPSIQYEFFGNGENLANTVDLFEHDPTFLVDGGAPLNQDSNPGLPGERRAVGTAVNLNLHQRLDQW